MKRVDYETRWERSRSGYHIGLIAWECATINSNNVSNHGLWLHRTTINPQFCFHYAPLSLRWVDEIHNIGALCNRYKITTLDLLRFEIPKVPLLFREIITINSSTITQTCVISAVWCNLRLVPFPDIDNADMFSHVDCQKCFSLYITYMYAEAISFLWWKIIVR